MGNEWSWCYWLTVTTPYSDVMVSSVTGWYDILVEKVKIFDDCAICPYRCAGSALDWVAYCTQLRMIWFVITYLCNMSASVYPMRSQLGSHIVHPCHNSILLHIWICSSMFIVNNPSSLFPFPYTMKSYDIFPKFHVCKHILSAYYKWFLVESTFNIFIFKLNDFNMDVHLCLEYVNSIVLI